MEILNTHSDASVTTAESPEPVCTCHGLDIEDFAHAIREGAKTVKSCFSAHGCMPQCGKCVWDIRDLLANVAGNK